MLSHRLRAATTIATLPYNGDVRRIPYHRSLSLMAVIALLLILLAPLVSRWLAHDPHAQASTQMPALAHIAPAPHHAHHHDGLHAGHGGGAGPMQADPHAHHQMSGHTATPIQPVANDAPANDPHAGHDMGVECDYCLIAARMVSLLVALLIALIGWHRRHFTIAWTLPHGTCIEAGHLGARGPPLHA